MALFVGYLFFGGGDDDEAGELATAQTKLFGEMAPVRCANPVECDNARARRLQPRQEVPGAGRRRSGQPLPRHARVRQGGALPRAVGPPAARHGRRRRARGAGARPRRGRVRRRQVPPAARHGRRAISKRCAVEAAALGAHRARRQHPYRVKLDAYRRTLPKPKEKASRRMKPLRRIIVSLLLVGCAAPQRPDRRGRSRSRTSRRWRSSSPTTPDDPKVNLELGDRAAARRRLAARRAVLPARRGARHPRSGDDAAPPQGPGDGAPLRRGARALPQAPVAARRPIAPPASSRRRSSRRSSARARPSASSRCWCAPSPTIPIPTSRSASSTATATTTPRARAGMFTKYLALAPQGREADAIRYQMRTSAARGRAGAGGRARTTLPGATP